MLAGLMLMAALAAGDPPAAPNPPVQPAAAAAKAPKPKLICVEEQQLGSLFKTRTCATKEEWDKRREHDAQAMSRRGGEVPSSCSGITC